MEVVTDPEAVKEVESALIADDYDANAFPGLGIVKVGDPDDPAKMYRVVSNVVSDFDVAMTAPTMYQVKVGGI